MNNKSILLLTLVHPDFLPPVYAVAQSLRDLDYHVHILTFDSFVPSEYNLGPNIDLESIGKHYDSSFLDRLKLRTKFIRRARQLAAVKQEAVISFCPFSFYCALKIKNHSPVMYNALEIADFSWSVFLRSPLSNYRNLLSLKNLHKADLIATPSIQRSAWLAGRCHLNFMPHTILNTSYIAKEENDDTYATYKEIVPVDFLDKKIILYTGAVNAEHCIIELIEAFEYVNDEQSALIITGIKDNPYCNEVKQLVEKISSRKRILLFPYVTRVKMLSLQANAHIGVCLEKEYEDNIRSKMMAPNKAGEYLYKKLYLLGISAEYMRPFEMRGIAALAATPTKLDIAKAIKAALQAVTRKDYKAQISQFVEEYFSMQQQIKPIIEFLHKK